MSNVAIIPARGGSKRIPRKNIKQFLGKPIIAYSIEVAIESGLFDDVMVSTDDKEIAEIAQSFGASIPFLRTHQSANDYATLSDTILEVLSMYEQKREKQFDNFCCILPTSPLLNTSFVSEAYRKLITNTYDSVFSAVQYSYPIQRSLVMDNDTIAMKWPEYLNSRSQDLEPSYHDAGQLYWMKTEQFKNKKVLWTDNSSAIILPEIYVQDIDTEEDWEIAELKYRLLNEKA